MKDFARFVLRLWAAMLGGLLWFFGGAVAINVSSSLASLSWGSIGFACATIFVSVTVGAAFVRYALTDT